MRTVSGCATASSWQRRLMARSRPGSPKMWSPCMCVMNTLQQAGACPGLWRPARIVVYRSRCSQPMHSQISI